MIAASLLVAAVVAAYASLAMLSLSASTSGIVLGAAANVEHFVGSVGWHPPGLPDVGVKVLDHAAAPTVEGAPTFSPIDFQRARGTGLSRIDVRNNGPKPVVLRVAVEGAPGVSALFRDNNGSMMTVKAGAAATIDLVSNPMVAGPIDGKLVISVPRSSLAPTLVPITGAQAPLPPGAVTATAAARGAVDLSWAPSPSSGVAGYVVESSTGNAPFTPVVGLITGTTVVEQTGTNATTFFYRVVAVASGVTPQLAGLPGPAGSAVTDNLAPDAPASVSIPAINLINVGSVPVTVVLPPTSLQSDTILVTLTDANGKTFTSQPLSGGPGPFTVNLPAGSLADGTVTASATAADTLGNTSQPTKSQSVPKITSLPDAATSVVPSDNPITSLNESNFSVAVATSAPDAAANDTITVTLASPSGSPSVTTTSVPAPADGTSTIPVANVSTLTDGDYTVTATVTDPAGNTATASADGPVTIDTTGPEKPANFGIGAGPNNPAGVINAQSQTAVTIAGHFADPLEDGEIITLSIDHGTPLPVDVAPGTQDFTLGPLDLSGLPDGQVSLKMKLTDSVGNVSFAWRNNGVKETSGPTGPSSIGVPAGPDNPAGYVNSATQNAATIVAGFDTPTDPGDQIALSVGGDSNFPVQSGGSDQVTWNNLDLSQFSDGNVPIVVTITDAAGNSTSVSGSLIKDTQAPTAPVAAHVLGPPLDTIPPGAGSCVNVGVAFNQAPDSSDTVTVTLSDGQSSVQGSTQAGDGQVTVGCIDASSLAPGSISVSVTVTDVAGNSTTMAGTTAVKAGCHHGSE
jgi:large repetitive protein